MKHWHRHEHDSDTNMLIQVIIWENGCNRIECNHMYWCHTGVKHTFNQKCRFGQFFKKFSCHWGLLLWIRIWDFGFYVGLSG